MRNIHAEILLAQEKLLPYIHLHAEKPASELPFGDFNMVCLYVLEKTPAKTILCRGSDLYECFLSIGIDERFEMMDVLVCVMYVNLHAQPIQ